MGRKGYIFGDNITWEEKDNVTYLTGMWTWQFTDITQPSLSPGENNVTSLFYGPQQPQPNTKLRNIINDRLTTLKQTPNRRMLQAMRQEDPTPVLQCKILQQYLSHADDGRAVNFSTILEPGNSTTLEDVLKREMPNGDVQL